MQESTLLAPQSYVEDILPPAELCDLPNATLFGEFENYAGIAANQFGKWPISWMHLSKPTGHYVSRFIMRCLNMVMKKHAILTVGNSCAPGLFFPETEGDKGWEQFQFVPGQFCGCLVVNVKGDAAAPKNAVVFKAEPFMVLTLDDKWKNYTDYLNAMQSKYRVRAKKVHTLSKLYQHSCLNGNEITPEITKQCSALLKHTLKDKTIAMPENLDKIIQTYCHYFKSSFSLHLYKKENQVVGFISYIQLGDTLHAMQLGIDSTEPKESQLYQRMLHDIVQTAIEMKCTRLNFGRTATEIKSTLGAVPEENSFVIYFKNNFFKNMTILYKKWFFKTEPYVVRNPFKENTAH